MKSRKWLVPLAGLTFALAASAVVVQRRTGR